MSANETTARPDLAVTRVRQSPKFRLAEVKRVTPLSSHLIRVTLGGADLHDFHSASFDDHVKVFFPAPGEVRPASPTLGPEGPVFGPGVARPVARDFTPRRYAPSPGGAVPWHRGTSWIDDHPNALRLASAPG
jgi:NADPH-dependent ferric siderophore reductase